MPREIEPPAKGKIISVPQVGGLRHRYLNHNQLNATAEIEGVIKTSRSQNGNILSKIKKAAAGARKRLNTLLTPKVKLEADGRKTGTVNALSSLTNYEYLWASRRKRKSLH